MLRHPAYLHDLKFIELLKKYFTLTYLEDKISIKAVPKWNIFQYHLNVVKLRWDENIENQKNLICNVFVIKVCIGQGDIVRLNNKNGDSPD